MPSIPIQDSFTVVSAADAKGNLTIASSTLLYPGTYGWLALDDGTASLRVKIKKVVDGTHIVVGPGEPQYTGLFGSAQYGRIDCSAFNGSAHLCIEAQTAPIDLAYSKRIGVG
jgi:hypothetical protein